MVLFWIGFGIVFLIVELITATFYGFSLAIAAFVVAIYVAVTGASNVDIVQGAIFAITALVTCYFFPKFFASSPESSDEKPQGLDMYIGERRRVRQVDEDFKVKLDGVEYLVVCDDDLEDKDLVEIVDRRGSIFIVEMVQN
ncbi:NfeD family protein [Candidatus Gracilibacteria bacterium]|nr:NfeD family protein [Candidatus Gracilibacteria bacterium]